MALSTELQNHVAGVLQDEGFTHHGFTTLQKPLSFEIYQNWIDEGKHGQMSYLKEF